MNHRPVPMAHPSLKSIFFDLEFHYPNIDIVLLHVLLNTL